MAKRVEPSPALLQRLEADILALLRDRGGKEFWTNIAHWINNNYINIKDPVQKEWVKLTQYGRGKVLGQVMDSLKDRSIVSRVKNFRPFILHSVLDRMVLEMEKHDEAEQT